MAEIDLRDVSKAYGEHRVLDRVSATFAQGSFSVLLGPPVSGKSVLMRLIMGLEPVDEGSVWLRGKDVTRTAAGTRHIGYVPQSFALYPHYRVIDNIAYPLALAGRSRDQIRPPIEKLAQKLKITHLLEKYPNQLSGGEKQRVALARGMIKDTSVFILDDPLVGLDFKLREQLFVDLRDMLSEVGGTFIYTTSDPLETLALADQVYILDEGRIQEHGPMDEMYYRPNHVRTLQLLGFPAANLISGEAQDGRCRTALGEFAVDLFDSTPRRLTVGFRAESIRFQTERSVEDLRATGRTLLQEDLGAETLIYFEAGGTRLVGAWSNAAPAPVRAEGFSFTVPGPELLLFDAETGERVIAGNARAGVAEARSAGG